MHKGISILLALIVVASFFYVVITKFGSRLQDTEEGVASPTSKMTYTMRLTSSAFEQGGFIPKVYTCDGEKGKSIPLSISGVPKGAQSLAFVMYDPDVPKQIKKEGMFDHWGMYNIPTDTKEVTSKTVAAMVLNGAGEPTYIGPCPPKEYEPTTHRYYFHLYALDSVLSFLTTPTKDQLVQALTPHIIGKAELMGRYDRTK